MIKIEIYPEGGCFLVNITGVNNASLFTQGDSIADAAAHAADVLKLYFNECCSPKVTHCLCREMAPMNPGEGSSWQCCRCDVRMNAEDAAQFRKDDLRP